MTILTIIYWVLLVLVLIGTFAPPEWPYWPRVNSAVFLVLFIIIGIKMFKTPLQ
jgi:hypothetical protein